MATETARQYLADVWATCRQARGWLVRSHGLVPRPPFVDLKPADWDQLEAMAARFARVIDLLLQKFMRALDRYELEETGSLLDTANRAVKRGFVDDVEVLRDLKDLRNEVAHEYVIDDLNRLYEEIYESTPVLLKILERAETYLEERHQFRT
jgi:uncharacterized protein YutE (UPF0331/DUF86 family)